MPFRICRICVRHIRKIVENGEKMKNKFDFRSEDGAASVLEAIIVYPLVFLVVIFLVLLGFTYVQKGYLTYHSQHLASYIAKVVCYPGYNYIEEPPYKTGSTAVTVKDIDNAMKQEAPYRYFFGLFGEYTAAKDQKGDIIPQCAEHMAKDYLTKNGFLKSSGGTVDIPASMDFKDSRRVNENGYACSISANTSRVVVYLGQNYVFANFFRMIGVGGAKMTIGSRSTAFITDSLEVVRITDNVFELANFVTGKFGIDTGKITKYIKKVTQNES